jgi:hypothetical protein
VKCKPSQKPTCETNNKNNTKDNLPQHNQPPS